MSKAAVIGASGAVVPDSVDKQVTAEMTRQRRRFVFRLVLRGLDENQIAQAISGQYRKDNISKVITPAIIRKDIEAMRGVVRGQILSADPWTEVAEHAQFFREMSSMAAQAALSADDLKGKAEMMRTAMTARHGLINLQAETGILPKARRVEEGFVPGIDGKEVSIQEMSLEQLLDLGESLAADPAVKKSIAEFDGGDDVEDE